MSTRSRRRDETDNAPSDPRRRRTAGPPERETDIADYDKVHQQILRMVDMLSDGIIRQFPEEVRIGATKRLP